MHIGKIEKTDWNVKEIEKKIEENKMGRGIRHDRVERVPKWSREQVGKETRNSTDVLALFLDVYMFHSVFSSADQDGEAGQRSKRHLQ